MGEYYYTKKKLSSNTNISELLNYKSNSYKKYLNKYKNNLNYSDSKTIEGMYNFYF